MRGRRTALVQAFVTTLAVGLCSACDLGTPDGSRPSAGPTLVADETAGDNPPELSAELEVELGTAVAVFGLGCRPQSASQRCSAGGEKTYTLRGSLRPATVTAAWMQLDTGGGRWVVQVRLDADDRVPAARTARQARDLGGLVVVLDTRTGDVLHAVSPSDVSGHRITRSDLTRLTAESVVSSFVAAAERS